MKLKTKEPSKPMRGAGVYDMNITLPYNFTPRTYQQPLLKALNPVYKGDKQKKKMILDKKGKPIVVRDALKRACLVWHRRSGKDITCLNYLISQMWNRVGGYYYFLPEYNQGRKVMWDGIEQDKAKQPFKYMGHFPDELLPKNGRNNQEMKITMKNGSIFQIIGTDRYDSVMGTNPVGCIFSEFSLQDPWAWEYISPILAENEGWAIFNFTPRGMNHAFKLFNEVQDNPNWFTEVLTVDETRRDDGTPVITEEMLQAERERGATEAFIRQEYYCDFTASSENRLISLDLILESKQRSYHQSVYGIAPKILGVDVAEGEVEGDSHAMIKRQGLQAFDLVVRKDCDTMVWANQVSNEILKWKPDAVFVDGIGVGAGVVARLKNSWVIRK